MVPVARPVRTLLDNPREYEEKAQLVWGYYSQAQGRFWRGDSRRCCFRWSGQRPRWLGIPPLKEDRPSARTARPPLRRFDG
jgi:hypothetical protein